MAADRNLAMRAAMSYYPPTGPLSGVSTSAIVIWLLAWLTLGRRWRNRTVDMRLVGAAAGTLLAIGLLLTFPPLADVLF
jgi:hypothetical protein